MKNANHIIDEYVGDQGYTLINDGPHRITFLKGEYGLVELVTSHDGSTKVTKQLDAFGHLVGREIVVYKTTWLNERAKACSF